MEYSKKILIAEDEPSIAKLMQRFAKHKGLETVIAENGLVAQALIDSRANSSRPESFPVIITDMNMPAMTGPELLRYVGEKIGAKEILKPEIFVFSSYDPHSLKFHEILEIGDHRKYQKPGSLNNLFESVKNEYKRILKIK
jgi:CheY-like chemotaxis protein